jgi:hypothetical protein
LHCLNFPVFFQTEYEYCDNWIKLSWRGKKEYCFIIIVNTWDCRLYVNGYFLFHGYYKYRYDRKQVMGHLKNIRRANKPKLLTG